MTKRTGEHRRQVWSLTLRAVPILAVTTLGLSAEPVSVAPASMPRLGAVDERFQSYNVEMVEVTGGRFWKPYPSQSGAAKPGAAVNQPGGSPAGISPELFEYRPPLDLSNDRLRKLAAALGPTHVRVSGTWANTVYFHDSDDPAPQKPPAGFNAILTRQQWKGVIDFARAVDGKLMTSFAVGPGTRDSAGVWTPEQARRVAGYSKTVGGSIAAAEFMNEPNFASIGGLPNGYDAEAYARDVRVFRGFIKDAAPGAIFLGPGSVGEGGVLANTSTPGRLRTEDLLKATGPVYDAFSYHLYAGVSQRCAGQAPVLGTTATAALSAEWLQRADSIHAAYEAMRDRFEAGKPIWLTETADAACGGNPWASTFLDTFRYLNQHGRLAQKGVQTIAHNTLSASDYGLLDEHTFTPRPNYWAALLWRRLMGRTVLNPGSAAGGDLYVYAHCMRDRPGGVTVLAINAAKTPQGMGVPMAGDRYTLTARELESKDVQLNGRELKAGPDGALPSITGTPVRAGQLTLAPTSITFVAFPQARNQACQSA
jgi:heparanase